MSYTVSHCDNCGRINRVAWEKAAGQVPVCGACGSELALHHGISELSGAGLRKLSEKSPLPLLVDFWAPWCGPCKAFAPTFQQAALQLKGKVALAKINTEAHPLAGEAYKVRSIPTIALFNGGLELSRLSGALPLEQLLQWVEGNLPK